MKIRRAIVKDLAELRDLYYGTITSVNCEHYNPEQIAAWAATADRTDSLVRKINEQYFFVVEDPSGKITGFASVDHSGYLDVLYVHKDFQRIGVASLLLTKILQTAKENGFQRLTTEAGITARPFFEKNNFQVIHEQTVLINGVGLTNYKMEAIL